MKIRSFKLSEKTRELLYKYYLSDIESLEELLSVNLSQWKKIGLVTITYNSADVIRGFLESILKQSF